ncbi:MAG: PIG-L family deacetylase [Planctomycetales bacterium]|nr:PIG-L family deacetylase [Planctomycetales bacterium]
MKRAFAIAAHPDDIEFVMSGTLLRLRSAGYELHYMNIANGCCGSLETDAAATARIRRDEARAAAGYLNATFHESLTNDLEIFYDRDTLMRLASVVRDVAPEIMLIHSPQDYMEDHMNACRLAVTAAFTRGMPNFPVIPPRTPVSQDVTLYHAQPHGNCDGLRQPVMPDFYVDVAELIPQKRELLALHVSQKRWLDASQGMDSYLNTMEELCRDVGKLSRVYTHAEGWRRHSHLGFCASDADPLRAALRPYASDHS